MQEVATVVGGMASAQTERAKERIHSPELLPRQVSLGRKMDRENHVQAKKGAESFTETKGYRNIMLKKKLNPRGPKKRKLVISLHI